MLESTWPKSARLLYNLELEEVDGLWQPSFHDDVDLYRAPSWDEGAGDRDRPYTIDDFILFMLSLLEYGMVLDRLWRLRRSVRCLTALSATGAAA